MDPLTASYPWNSPYAFSENRVIDAIELEGLEKFLIQNKTNADGNTQLKVLTVTDVTAPFQIIDEDGNSCTDFKYCEFRDQMEGYSFNDHSANVFSKYMLITPNKLGDQKMFQEFES